MLSLQQKEKERLRQEALYKYQILDSPREDSFDNLTTLASYICKVPNAFVSFIDYDAGSMFIKSSHGAPLAGTNTKMDVRTSFCFYACEQEDPVLMIEDATVVDKYKNMDVVRNEPYFNFYAGAPLVTPSGCKLGTLCVMDNKSNYLDEHQLKALSQLAQQVVAQLELRLSVLLLKKKTQVLERINDDKNRFIGAISHDIRQPLQSIMICSELMLQDDDCQIPELYVDALETTHSSAKLMHNMVDELLQLVKCDFNTVPIVIEPRFTDVIPILNRIVSNNRLYAKKKSIVLDFRISIANLNRKDEEPTVAVTYEQWEHEYQAIPISCFIDPAKLEQALNNLLTNAIKFSEPKSVVEVRVGRKSNQVYISVKDHGLGIPKDEIPLLFEPYKKISVKPTRGETSTGLGLSIVRAIVLAHDGDVVVESEVGVGSKFTILLPPPSIVSKEPVVTGKDSLTILLADDNVVLQKLVASAFKKRQHHVILASDGNEALQEWEKYKDQINVIIMDEEMPRHNGNEVTELIRAREKELKTRPANIIACTSVAETSHDSLLKAKGANSVLIKPYSLDTLISIVERTNKT